MIRTVLSALALLLIASVGPQRQVAARQSRLEIGQTRLQPAGPWTAASPITLTVTFEAPILLASWQWVEPNGQPAQWLEEELPSFEMKPLGGSPNTWVGRGAAPPVPGSYKARLTARPTGSQAGTSAPEQSALLSVGGEVSVDEQPLTRGFAFVRDRNLWLRSTDLMRDRAVTFYEYPALASMPAWSPDGRWIAYILDPGTAGSTTELWLIRPDGTGARRVASANSSRPISYPQFAPDGTLLVCQARSLVGGDVELGWTWDLHRVDTATGKLTLLQSSTTMPAVSWVDGRVVFIRDTATSDGALEQSLVVSDLDGSHERTIVGPGLMNGLSAPAWSPNGTKVVFASVGLANPSGFGKAGLAAPLMHGGVWDLWVVPASGGTPTLMSAVQEDLPFPQWPLDGSRIYFISPTGFWGVPASGGPPELLRANDLHSELSVFAPQPAPAQPLAGGSACFAETGHCLRGVFLHYWESRGGLALFGLPISPELIEEGRTVQYTERARFEWHTENQGTEYEVLAGRLGADMAEARAALGEEPFGSVGQPADNSILYFPETGHTLTAPLRAYWEAHGGLPVFGYPLSQAFQERSPTDGETYLVQYFERNRLEYHLEFKGTSSEVLLGLLGSQEYARRYADE
jgi:hypothetical protein